MKQVLAIMVVVSATAQAAPPVNIDPYEVSNVLVVKNVPFGSGVPTHHEHPPGPGETTTWTSPITIENNIYHTPQYLPYHPTAATIWPRVVEVPCAKHYGVLKCEGYHWSPALGRAEYLYVTPTLAKEPVVITKEIQVPGPTITILKEVPVKKKRE